MSAVTVAADPPTLSKDELLNAYDQIIRIRDEFFAKNALTQQQSNQSAILANAQPAFAPGAPANSPYVQSSASKLAPVSSAVPEPPSSLQVPNNRPNPFQPISPNVQRLPASVQSSSGIDPIFLTKSDVLVRAEIYQKRQRIERQLEEQVHRSQKQKAVDQDAIPEFDATDVLKKAQELVKPIKPRSHGSAPRAPSSSDSFDENTFYSSQMDESTTTEEADESGRKRTRPICNFFLRGETCRYGRTCTFSHDPALKQKLEADASRKADHDRGNANQQPNPRPANLPSKQIYVNSKQPEPKGKADIGNVSGPQSQAEQDRLERIARLEAELKSVMAEQDGAARPAPTKHTVAINGNQEESTKPPSGPDEFGRDVGLREPSSHQPIMESQRRAENGTNIPREYGQNYGKPRSPIADDVRVITNHIRSPVAPQPSRVSPLAVAKVPQVSQIQRAEGEILHSSRASNPDHSSAAQSPNVASQSRNPRKRRRGRDSGEQIRNVVPRTDQNSPSTRIKEEPVSPPPFAVADPDIRHIRARQEAPRQSFVENPSDRYRAEDSGPYRPRVIEQQARGPLDDGRLPQTPIVRRVISRNGQHYMTREDQDLRRVVTAPRQVRAPLSPGPYPVQYSAPQTRATRAASQVHVSPTVQGVHNPYRASIQPLQQSNAGPQSPSPPSMRLRRSPPESHLIAMPPPPPRIVIDQWGNRFMEAPMPIDRHVSLAPPAHVNDPDPRYEQIVPRSGSVLRQPQITRLRDEGRRVSSPSMNGYHEAPVRQVAETRNFSYHEEPYILHRHDARGGEYFENRPPVLHAEPLAQASRIVRMESVRPQERAHDGFYPTDERVTRMPSARPAPRDYEGLGEQLQRVQSVRPEQPRIIRLGEKRDPPHQGSRHASVVPDQTFMPTTYTMDDRPRYQYAPQIQQGGYVEEIVDGGGYEAPNSNGRRTMQRV